MTPRRFFLVALLTAISLFDRTALLAVSQNYTAAWPYCSTTGNYTVASSYQVNLVKLMADLQAGAIDNRGFNVSMAGKSPDTVFGLIRWTLMSRLMGEASSSPLRLANQSEVFQDYDGSSELMYGLAQCTRDLNSSECTRCLTHLVAELSNSRPNNTYGAVKGYSAATWCTRSGETWASCFHLHRQSRRSPHHRHR